jgi:hypothetical protein
MLHNYNSMPMPPQFTPTVAAAFMAILRSPSLPPPTPPSASAKPPSQSQHSIPAGPSPTHAIGATGPQITETNREYSETQRLFKLYDNVDKALRNQLIKTTPLMYLEAIADPTTGFGNTGALQLLSNLKDRYGTIDNKALDDNLDHMKTPWRPPTPIEQLFKQIENGHKFANDGSDPLSDRQLVRVAYNIINDTGHFALATCD